MNYNEIADSLRQSYNQTAAQRDQTEITGWKAAERGEFLKRLQEEKKETLLEIGAGPGRDSKFFQDNGLTVTCTDLSPEMVRLCQAKGLDAHVMDFAHLDFPIHSFDALFALNCLLHVPKADLPAILHLLHSLLKPDGLFYMGVYGGLDSEGLWEDDLHEPKRFFSFYTDEQIEEVVSKLFTVLSFKRIIVEQDALQRPHFQSMILRPR